MTRTTLKMALMASSILASAGYASAQDTTLTIESWRTDDLAIWQEKIIPAFEAKNPGIKVKFAPTAPTEYNAALNAKLDAGSAGDLITCRPFDKSLELYNKGNLADLTGLPGMENFSDVAKSAWTTDDGKATFCVPMASVIHGFIYNKDAFDKLGIARAGDRGRVLRRARQDQGRRHLHPAGHGHQGPVGSRDHGLPEHRPELLEGRGRPPGADQGRAEADRRAMGRALCRARQVEALSRRRLRGADLSGQPEPVHARPRRHLSGRLVGNRAVQHAGAVQDGRLPAAGEDSRRHLLHLRSHRHRDRPQRQERRMPMRPRPSCPGSPRRSSRRSTPTRCRASSACPRRR